MEEIKKKALQNEQKILNNTKKMSGRIFGADKFVGSRDRSKRLSLDESSFFTPSAFKRPAALDFEPMFGAFGPAEKTKAFDETVVNRSDDNL